MKKTLLFLGLIFSLLSCRTSSVQTIAGSAVQTDSSFIDAEAARLKGDWEKASNLYETFLQQHPHNGAALFNLARIRMQHSSHYEAEKLSGKASEADPGNRYYREFYARALLLNRQYKKAAAQYDFLMQHYPREEDYLYEFAMIQQMTRQDEKALESFNRLEDLMGFNEDLILQKKTIELRLGHLEAAADEIRKLIAEDHSTARYDLMLAELYDNAGQKEKATAVYKEIETRYPQDPMAQMTLAQAAIMAHDTLRYNHFMQQLMLNRNLDAQTKISLILPSLRKLAHDSSQQDMLIDLAHNIVDQAPDKKEPLSLYADLLYSCGKIDSALPVYRRYLGLDSMKFNVWNQVLAIYAEQQKSDSVLAISQHCMKLFPTNAMPYFFSGITLMQQKKHKDALVYLQQGMKLEKENKAIQAQLLSSMAEVYHTLQQHTYSDSCFEVALQLQPDDATLLNNYAYYLSERKLRLDKAEEMSKHSLELQPASKSFLDTYGWIQFQQGRYREAQLYIRKALDSNGMDDGTLHEHLGDVYDKLGEHDKAKEEWMKAKEKGESTPVLLRKIQTGHYEE